MLIKANTRSKFVLRFKFYFNELLKIRKENDMKKFLIIVYLISNLFLEGCNTDSENSLSNKNVTEEKEINYSWYEDINTILNEDNPYNALGIFHNEGVEWVNNQTGGEYDTLTIEEIKDKVSGFIINYDENDLWTINEKDTIETLIGYYDNIEFNIDSLVTGMNFNANQELWVRNFYIIMNSEEFDEDCESAYDSILNKLNILELEIINSNEYSEKKEIPLAILSIGKCSLFYWNQVANQYYQLITKIHKKISYWGCPRRHISKEDAEGFGTTVLGCVGFGASAGNFVGAVCGAGVAAFCGIASSIKHQNKIKNNN